LNGLDGVVSSFFDGLQPHEQFFSYLVAVTGLQIKLYVPIANKFFSVLKKRN
jgi:hypothetical protein